MMTGFFLDRLLPLFRLQPFDTSTEAGRSKERLRRAGMTTVSTGAAKVIGVLASLITVPLTYRYLGPEQYGLWMVLASLISAMSFADLGIGLGLVNAISEAYGKEDRDLARKYVTSAFAMLLGLSTFLTLAGAFAYPFIPWMKLFNVQSPVVAAEGAKALVVLYASFVINIPLDIATRVQTGLQRGYIPQTFLAVGGVGTLLALVVVIRFHGSLVWLVFGSTIGPIASAIANAGILFHRDPWLLPSLHAFRIRASKKILQMGLMFFVLQCAVVLGYTSDNIVINQVMGAGAVAAYAVPQKIFSPIATVIGIALTPLWPAYGEALARGDVEWVRRTFWRSTKLVLAIAFPCCALLVYAGPWILQTFFGKTLHAPTSLLIALGLWTIVVAISYPIAMLLNGAGYLKIQMIVAAIASVCNLGLSILFTRRFGVIGVCLGSIIAQTVLTIPLCSISARTLLRRLATMKSQTIGAEIATGTPGG